MNLNQQIHNCNSLEAIALNIDVSHVYASNTVTEVRLI